MKNAERRGYPGACRLIGVGNARNPSTLMIEASPNPACELCDFEFALREIECPRLCQRVVGLSSLSCVLNRMSTNSFPAAPLTTILRSAAERIKYQVPDNRLFPFHHKRCPRRPGATTIPCVRAVASLRWSRNSSDRPRRPMVERKLRSALHVDTPVKTSTPKLFVLDTNVLMHDPTSLFRFEEHDVFLPIGTLEELDANKKGLSDVSRNARQASRFLDEIVSSVAGSTAADIRAGIPLAPKAGEAPH